MERRKIYMIARFFRQGEVARHLTATTPIPAPRVPPKVRWLNLRAVFRSQKCWLLTKP